MNCSRKLLATVARTSFRQMSKSSKSTPDCVPKEIVNPAFYKLKETQKRFGIEDNVPIYLKGGLKDKLLYQFTLVLVAIGLGMSVDVWYQLATK